MSIIERRHAYEATRAGEIPMTPIGVGIGGVYITGLIRFDRRERRLSDYINGMYLGSPLILSDVTIVGSDGNIEMTVSESRVNVTAADVVVDLGEAHRSNPTLYVVRAKMPVIAITKNGFSIRGDLCGPVGGEIPEFGFAADRRIIVESDLTRNGVLLADNVSAFVRFDSLIVLGSAAAKDQVSEG